MRVTLSFRLSFRCESNVLSDASQTLLKVKRMLVWKWGKNWCESEEEDGVRVRRKLIDLRLPNEYYSELWKECKHVARWFVSVTQLELLMWSVQCKLMPVKQVAITSRPRTTTKDRELLTPSMSVPHMLQFFDVPKGLHTWWLDQWLAMWRNWPISDHTKGAIRILKWIQTCSTLVCLSNSA